MKKKIIQGFNKSHGDVKHHKLFLKNTNERKRKKF